MIRAMARMAVRRLRSLAQEPGRESVGDGLADVDGYSDKIARYRALGVHFGEKVRFAGDVDGVNPHLVSIGDYTVVGRGSILLAHCPIKGPLPVSVGRFVYIGYGAILLPGVTIGDHCIVGAGAVVTKSAPACSILVGNPARILRMTTLEERARIEDVLRRGLVFGWDPNRPV